MANDNISRITTARQEDDMETFWVLAMLTALIIARPQYWPTEETETEDSLEHEALDASLEPSDWEGPSSHEEEEQISLPDRILNDMRALMTDSEEEEKKRLGDDSVDYDQLSPRSYDEDDTHSGIDRTYWQCELEEQGREGKSKEALQHTVETLNAELARLGRLEEKEEVSPPFNRYEHDSAQDEEEEAEKKM